MVQKTEREVQCVIKSGRERENDIQIICHLYLEMTLEIDIDDDDDGSQVQFSMKSVFLHHHGFLEHLHVDLSSHYSNIDLNHLDFVASIIFI